MWIVLSYFTYSLCSCRLQLAAAQPIILYFAYYEKASFVDSETVSVFEIDELIILSTLCHSQLVIVISLDWRLPNQDTSHKRERLETGNMVRLCEICW